jgi:hypothetical protein
VLRLSDAFNSKHNGPVVGPGVDPVERDS